MRNPIHALAARLLSITFTVGDYEFILRQASPSERLAESLHIYLPPNLSLAQTALVTAAILREMSTPDLIQKAIESHLQISGRWCSEPEVLPEIRFGLVDQIQQLLAG